MSFPGGSDGKESAGHAGDSGSIPGLGRFLGEGNGNLFPWGREWQPIPILLLGELHGLEECGELQSMGPRRV